MESRTALFVSLAVSSVVFSGVAEPPAGDRVATARGSREAGLRQRCANVGLPYPPRELFIRAFKREGEVEAWAREDSGQFRLLANFPVTAASGALGPKRRQGDRQVPEGCYRISVFNPLSKFHLSLGLDYPNASDRVRSDHEHPGAEIYIHGSNRSVGCLPIGNAAIEELYLLAQDVRARGQGDIPVHIFPARMGGDSWRALLAEHPQLAPFWKELEPIYEAFEKNRQVPRVEITSAGVYRLVRPARSRER